MLISRQPVFDRKKTVQGYESCVQWKTSGYGSRSDVVNTIAENFEDLASNRWSLVSLPTETIEYGGHEVLSKDRTLLRPLGQVHDKNFLKCLKKLESQGYRVVVNDPEAYEAANPKAGIAYLNLEKCGRGQLGQIVDHLHDRGATVMAGAVNTHEDFDICRDGGVDLFEGRFFCQPGAVSRKLPPQQLSAIKLLPTLLKPDVRLTDIEELEYLSSDLGDRLLNLANSPHGGLARPVDSLRYAVGAIGIENMRRWASLLLLSMIEGKPRELLITAAIRARMSELLADSDDEGRQAVFFKAGLLSTLEAYLDHPIKEIADEFSFSTEVREALVNGADILGATLDAIMAYEAGDWDSIYLKPFHPSMIRTAYFDALHWTRIVTTGLMI